MAVINDPNTAANIVTVKPASTAAVAADNSLVITAHPSSAALPVAASGNGNVGSVSPFGSGQRVATESIQLFIDTYDSALDTANNWNAPTTGSGGVAFAFSTASITGGSGTLANGFSMLGSQASFQPTAPGFLDFQTNINIEFPVLTNAVRFWGFATAPVTPTAVAPLTNAIGFEINTAGKLFAVTYQSGTRVPIQDLSSSGNNKQPADSSAHKYYCYVRGDVAYWAIDNRDAIVASMPTGAQGPDVTTLPLRYLTVNGVTPPASSATLVVNATIVGDTAGNNFCISDPNFPFRQQTVKAASTAAAAADNPAVVALHPSSPLPAGTNAIGNVGVAQASTTAGQVGELTQGAVTTAAPTYTTAQTSPLSLTTAGGLRHDLASVAGTATGTAAAGVQKVGIVGNANAAIDGAIGAVPPANALQVGAKAATANPTNATAGNQVALMADKAGRLVVTEANVRENVVVQATTIAAASVAETTIVTAGAAGVFNDISSLLISTTNSAAATLTIRDATAGTTRAILDFPDAALAPGVGVLQLNFNPPIPQAVAANNWTAQASANAAGIHITAVFVKNL